MQATGRCLRLLLCLGIAGSADIAVARPQQTRGRSSAHEKSRSGTKVAMLARGGSGAQSSKSALLSSGRGGKSGRGRGERKRRAEKAPQMPAQLDVLAIDLNSGMVQVGVVGTSRPPDGRLFVFLDERQRRFVPGGIECHPSLGLGLGLGLGGAAVPAAPAPTPAPANGEPPAVGNERWQCGLTIPRIYRRFALIGLSMEWGDKMVAAPASRVRTMWAEAREKTPNPVEAERPRDAASPAPPALHTPDGGPTIDSDGLDSESEEE